MARTGVPSAVIDVHKLVKFLTRYQAAVRAAMVSLDPTYGAVFDDLLAALLAFDALSGVLYPLED